MMRGIATLIAGLCLSFAGTAAIAAGPEQIDQLEPDKGDWQLEYFGTFSGADENDHALEAMVGLSDKLALGIEVEGEYSNGDLRFDTVAAKALYRLTPKDAEIGAGLQLEAAFDDRASLAEVEARLIVSSQSESWWSQGNTMLRRSTDDGRTDISGAYAWSVQRSLSKSAWLGLEGSGQVGRRSCDDEGCESDSGHFAGPSFTLELEHGRGAETEFGLAALRSLARGESDYVVRLFVQTTF
jgi:hypothetical protein